MQALDLLVAQRLITDASLYAERVELVVLPPLCPLSVSPIDFGQAGQLIERARTTAGKWLDATMHALSGPELLSLHDHRAAKEAAGNT